MMYTYKGYSFSVIDNKVSLWMLEENPDENKPSLFQPFDPRTGDSFADEETAKTWTESHIENNYVNPQIMPYPPFIRTLMRQSIEELAQLPEDIKIQLPEDIQIKIGKYLFTQTAPVAE